MFGPLLAGAGAGAGAAARVALFTLMDRVLLNLTKNVCCLFSKQASSCLHAGLRQNLDQTFLSCFFCHLRKVCDSHSFRCHQRCLSLVSFFPFVIIDCVHTMSMITVGHGKKTPIVYQPTLLTVLFSLSDHGFG